jgi:PAS domain S-box-containing protein
MEVEALRVTIVGGGPGCKAIMEMMFAEKLSQLQMWLIGVACTNPDAVGYRFAQERGIYTTRDYRDLYQLEGLDMIIELTGRDEVANEISQTKPVGVRLIDHVAARLFWDIFQIEERRLEDRKQAQEALARSEKRFRQIAENAEEWIWEVDERGLYTYSSPVVERILGYRPEELVGQKHFYDLFHPEEREALKNAALEAFSRKESLAEFVNRNIHKDGTVVWLSTSAVPIVNADGKLVGYRGADTNITHRKQTEEAMVRAKEDWENTFDAIPDMVMLLDSEHRILRVNQAVAAALKTDKESLVGKKCYEACHRQSHPIRKCPLLETLKTRSPHTVEITDPVLGGTFLCTTSPIWDKAGDLRGYAHSLKDVTESKRFEAQFHQAQKMEAIGTLAGGIAHDFNNLLMAIQGRTSLMLLDTGSEHSHFSSLRGIEEMVKRGANLSKQLLGFARGGKYEVKPTDLNQLVRNSSEMFGRTKKEIRIQSKYEPDLWPVEADQGQIEQVLLNLYVNAWQAMPGGGDLYLETSNVHLDQQFGQPFNVAPGKYVKISVTDSGMGMDEATRQRVFEPFFTTRELGGGSGLGLASAYGIINNHGGMITVYSEPGHGSRFDVYLPASRREVPRAKETSGEILSGSETVLLVDDEDMVLEVGKEMLTALGYKVLVAESGTEAVRVYEDHHAKIDLVVLDLIMPDIGGGEVYDHLMEINPAVKVLLSSGYSIDGEADDILKRGCDGFIQKPFDVKNLSVKLREILDGRLGG